MRLANRATLLIGATTLLAIAIAFGASWLAEAQALSKAAAFVLATAAAAPFVVWGAHALSSRVNAHHDVIANALAAFREGDYGLRLTVRGDREIAEIKRLFNELADAVRADRQDLHQKEVLLDTILQRTPLAVVVLNAAGRVVYSNAVARELIGGGARLNGRLVSELELAAPLRDALACRDDSIFGHEDETFHLSQRAFHVNSQSHSLIIVERLTPELRRQEIGVWKKAIRVINHEINNSVAPISSLFHSVRLAQDRPEHRHRVEEIYELIEERLAFLRGFLDDYAEFARLPEPRREPVLWGELLDSVAALYEFRVEGATDLECAVDRSQMQLVLINLVKNAHEAASPPEEIVVSVQRAAKDCLLRVADRGRGMPEEVLRQALVPFYTTKPGGSGVGLALCNEIVEAHRGRMRLEARPGGGTLVTCWIRIEE